MLFKTAKMVSIVNNYEYVNKRKDRQSVLVAHNSKEQKLGILTKKATFDRAQTNSSHTI